MSGLVYDGFPSLEEIKAANGFPSDERFGKGAVAVVECVQEIPCNPCEDACPFGAIHVGSPITNCPKVDYEKCTGCGICVAQCSGLAIFIVNKNYSETEATVSFPFEYYPLPEVGATVDAVSRAAEFVCKGKVVRVLNTKKNDHTAVVTVAIPKEHADNVRSIKRLGAKEVITPEEAVAKDETLADDVIVCRCEEITAGEIRKVINEGADSVTAVKRRVRAGMGLCQGKSCGRLITRMITEVHGKPAPQIAPAADRPPVRPITFGELGGEDNE